MTRKRIANIVVSNDLVSKRWRSTVASARMAYEVGEFRQAENLLARAMELAHQLPERDFAEHATEVGLAAVLLADRRVDEATARLEKSVAKLERYAEASHKELLGVALRFHAEALNDGGKKDAAEQELMRSKEVLESLGEAACVQLAYTLCDLSGLYLTQGRFLPAEKYIIQAMAIISQVLGSASPEYVREDMIYLCCLPMKDDERLETVSDGIMKMEYQYGPKHPNVTRALDQYFKVLAKRGDPAMLAAAVERFGNTSPCQQANHG